MLNILKNITRPWICTNPAIIRNCLDTVNNLPYVTTTSQRAFISTDKRKKRKFGVGLDEEVANSVNVTDVNQSLPPNMYLWIDIDCFECQLRSILHPELQNKPLVIVGPKPRQTIFAIDYAARSFGVNKADTVDSARLKCPNLIAFEPMDTTKTEHSRMREKILQSIENFIADELDDRVPVNMLEFEEVLLNIGEVVDDILSTPNGFEKFPDNPWTEKTKWILRSDHHHKLYNDEEDIKRLQIGANIFAELLRRLQLDTGLYASGSIGCSSYIARLACSLNKPRGITVVTNNGLEQLFSMVKIVDTPGMKGKTGQKIINEQTKPDGSKMETLHDWMLHGHSREEIAKILKSYSCNKA